MDISLLGNVLRISANTAGLLHDIQNAPAAIIELQNQITSFQSLLQKIMDHPSQNEAIAKELNQATKTLEEIMNVLLPYVNMDQQKKITITRIKWVVKDKEKATRLRMRISSHVSTIGLLLEMENM